MNNLIKLWLHQDTSIIIKGAHSPLNVFINDAIGTATIKDRDGVVLAGPVNFEYIVDSDGNYIAVLPEVSSAVAGQRAKLYATLTSGAGLGSEGEWEYNAVFEARTQNSDCSC